VITLMKTMNLKPVVACGKVARRITATVLAAASLLIAGNLSAEIEGNERNPFTFIVPNDCAGEWVLVEGIFHASYTPYEQEHGAHYRVNAHGRGIGELSGREYVFNDTVHDTVQRMPDGSWSETIVTRTRLVSKGKGENVTLLTTINLGVDEDGNFFFQIVEATICQGK